MLCAHPRRAHAGSDRPHERRRHRPISFISIAVDDEIDEDFLSVLQKVDKRFVAVPSPIDDARPNATPCGWAIRKSFPWMCCVRCAGRTAPRSPWLRSLRAGAQLVAFLDYLLYREINAVAPHGPGIPINVPAPERFALHKLIVSQIRVSTSRSQAKRAKDLAQARSLDRLLCRRQADGSEKPHGTRFAGRVPSWRNKTATAAAPCRMTRDPRCRGLSVCDQRLER